MAHPPPRRGLSAGIARIAKLGRGRSVGEPEASPEKLDRRLPEQRILDTAARYPALGAGRPARHRGGSTTAQAANDPADPAASADPAAAAEPTWVRRLDDQIVVMPTLPGAHRSDRAHGANGRPASPGRRRSPIG